MATTDGDPYVDEGRQYFNRRQWREAADAFNRALQAAAPAVNPDALIGRACALRFTGSPQAVKIAAFAAARPVGLDDPQFWLISIRFYLHTAAKQDSGEFAGHFRVSLYRDALTDLEHGTEKFKGLVASGDRLAYPWGIALVRLADWMDAYIHPRRHEPGKVKHPYRTIGLELYELIVKSDIGAIFESDKSGIRGEIERDVTGHARRQLNMRADAGGSDTKRSHRQLRNRGGSATVRRAGIAGAVILVTMMIELLTASSFMTAALDMVGTGHWALGTGHWAMGTSTPTILI